jgi:chaperonin cofactor prefoldin
VRDVVRYLKLANDLPGLEKEYERLNEGVNSLEEQRRNSDRKLVELNNQVTEASNYLEHYRTSCRQEERKLEGLRQKRVKEEALVRQFENNNREYIKIIKTAEEAVTSTLSKGKDLIKLALLSLTESMKKCPENYISMICYDTRITDYGRKYHPSYGYGFYTYGQRQYQSQNYDREDYMAMLVEEADKLHHTLVKELVDESISNYAVNTPPPSLLYLLPSDQEELPPKTS